MKNIVVYMVLCLLLLCGCSSENRNLNGFEDENIYEEAYNEGYEDGYENGYDESYHEILQNPTYHVEELERFYISIAELMYDSEYETVEKLLDYYPKGVEKALEMEFGVKEINTIIDYLEEQAQTVIGNCEICGESVYADEITILPDGIECAHHGCISENNTEKTYKIKKDK